MGRKTAKKSQVDTVHVAEAERAVREAKSLPISKLPRANLTDSAQGELERRLVQRGLERHGNAIRVPIEAQLHALLQVGAHVPITGITRHIKGARKPEITGVVSRLIRAKQAFVVLRGDAEVVVGADVRVLSPAEIARLSKAVGQLAGMLKRIGSKGEPRTLLRDDVAALLEGIQEQRPEKAGPPAVIASASSTAPRQIVELALRRLEDPELKLVRIPDLVRSLDGKLSVSEVHHALSEAADGGAIELHPDAGSEFLPTEDAVLCPPGPRNTVFSYARLLSP